MDEFLCGISEQTGLEQANVEIWDALSKETLLARMASNACNSNDSLEAAARKLSGHPVHHLFHMWRAENLSAVGDFKNAVSELTRLRKDVASLTDKWIPFKPAGVITNSLAQVLVLANDFEGAGGVLSDAYFDDPERPNDLALNAASYFESAGFLEKARNLSESVIRTSEAVPEGIDERYRTNPDTLAYARDVSLRGIKRLEVDGPFHSSVLQLADAVVNSVINNDTHSLGRLASKTHFSVSGGCHRILVETDDCLDRLFKVISHKSCSRLSRGRMSLTGKGDHRILDLGFVSARSPLTLLKLVFRKFSLGWEWVGLLVPDEGPWLRHLPVAPREENQPLQIPFRSPWHRDFNFLAGGIAHPWHGGASGIDLNPLSILFKACTSACGYGRRGYYYNHAVSHNGPSAFAVDFTHYDRCLAFFDKTTGKEVLAPAHGIVSFKNTSGSSGTGVLNSVEIIHPFIPGPCKYRSRYLHLAGPYILLSVGILIRPGYLLGWMNDTGNSAWPHLHFSIHDMDRGSHPWSSPHSARVPLEYGVRLNPLDGQRLDDADHGRCCSSTNHRGLVFASTP